MSNLLPCKYCNYAVAPKAAYCPKCGGGDPTADPEPEIKRRARFPFLEISMGVCGILGAAAGGIFGYERWGIGGALVLGFFGGWIGAFVGAIGPFLAFAAAVVWALIALWGYKL